jgi:hypothetical protein
MPGLVTYPRDDNNGMIRGMYPPFKVQDGDHFRALIQCRYNSAGCNVVFRLDYQIGNGAINNLGQWNEAYEGQYFPVDVDLTTLSGSNVKFMLTVLANGAPTKDFAIWIGPRITRQGDQPPAVTKTVILPYLAAESGSVLSTGGVDLANVSVGDNVANEGVEAFLSFDLSAIPANATIQSATLKLVGGGAVHGNPFATLGCLRAYAQNFATVDASDFVAPGATGAFASWCNNAGLASDLSNPALVTVLQNAIGTARFRFRLQFRDILSDNNATMDDVLIAAPVTLTVTYTLP